MLCGYVSAGLLTFDIISNTATTSSPQSSSSPSDPATAAAAAGAGNKDLLLAAMDRFKQLYPNVNEEDTPLPRFWSTQDKCNTIGLTQNNLRVHYKGIIVWRGPCLLSGPCPSVEWWKSLKYFIRE